MNETDKAIARSCLEQVELGLAELGAIATWWKTLSFGRQREYWLFRDSVKMYRKELTEPRGDGIPPADG